MRLGVGYRKPLAKWINSRPPLINCLELTAEHFFDNSAAISALRAKYDLMLHGLGLSLGTPGPLDQVYLQQFVDICRVADPLWVSEHIAFSRTGDVDLGHLNPIPYTQHTLDYFVDHALEIKSACQKPLLLENITTHIHIKSPISESEFINLVCERAGCFLLLDVTNLYVNSRNHGYDAENRLREIHPAYIKQLHIVGYSQHDGHLQDSHDSNIQHELFELTHKIIEYANVEAIIIERDNHFPPVSQLEAELATLEHFFESATSTTH